MTPQEVYRDNFIATIDHLDRIAHKISGMLGRGGTLTFPDHQKLSEGLFLSAWTHWEEFIRQILIEDLAVDSGGFLKKNASNFRNIRSPRRLAERILFHPDHPDKFVEWDYSLVRKRADQFLTPNHRFVAFPRPRHNDLDHMKRIRNAIAHKSDRAWESFKTLVIGAPFNLTLKQRQGLTVGRFLVSHNWGATTPVLLESFAVHQRHARILVP